MKTKLLIALLLINISVYAQGFRFSETSGTNVSVTLEPKPTLERRSPNLIFEFEYEENFGYVKVASQILPALEGGYIDLAGGVGLSFTSGYFKQMRYTIGIRGGFIKRADIIYPLFGQELNILWNIPSTKFNIGIRLSNDYREDFKFTGGDPGYRQNAGFKIQYML
jgi:hypothetical protein